MNIGRIELSKYKTFVIAEVGNNHNGNFKNAIKMIDLAVEMNADCVKFQIRDLKELYTQKALSKSGEDLGTEYILDLLEKFELTTAQHKELAKYCQKKGIIYMCTPWDNSSVDILEEIGVVAYKVASADLTNINLISKLCKTKKPLILSTGMSTRNEIEKTVDFLNKNNADYALLHCNSTYPAPLHDINLNWINELKKIHPVVGYSGHERGTSVSLAAISLGASIIERHFTLDRNMEGPDHAASLEFLDFKNLINGIREIELALGNENQKSRQLSQGEMINRENLSKSLVASRKIKKGTIICRDDIKVMSPGQGLSPQNIEKLIGKKINRNIDYEGYFFYSDIDKDIEYNLDYSFRRKWGIPVRYHDFKKFDNILKPDIFEFHLSYSDMELNINDFIDKKNKLGFVVHAPELFKGSHLMDLASFDENYRKISVSETQKVINITRELNNFFPSEIKPMIVANIGGFSMDKPFSEDKKKILYENFCKSLNLLDMSGVELIPQTMAPFPWHFGGQRFQNIFVKPNEIIEYCEKFNLRICLDVSHSFLTSNHFDIDFYNFIELVAPYTAHIHMGDASGLNGEGLQIGDGEIDFSKLNEILNRKCPNASFIPEIWQGHKNDGKGFWIALEKLNNSL
ncbi:MAG: acetylneuraminic acid synthetase [Gammaproteobacteria bacterium]|nr:acetylneuraminic acid synthetase [Gammaproteobacteria bacterium]